MAHYWNEKESMGKKKYHNRMYQQQNTLMWQLIQMTHQHENMSSQYMLGIPGNEEMRGVNVTISFLSHVFFLILVVHYPYFQFAPQHEEVDLNLLTFPHFFSPLLLPL